MMPRGFNLYCTLLLAVSLVSPFVRGVPPPVKADNNITAVRENNIAAFLESKGLLITGQRVLPGSAAAVYSLASSGCAPGLRLLVLPSAFNMPEPAADLINKTTWQKQFVFDGHVVQGIGPYALAPSWLRGKFRVGFGTALSSLLAFKPLVLMTPPECAQPDIDWTPLRNQ
jgi:hypothetical protein